MTLTGDFDAIVKLMQEGRRLKDQSKPVLANRSFDVWLHNGTEYLLKNFGHQIAAEWEAMPDGSCLVRGGHYYEDQYAWNTFHKIIDQRLQWLGSLPNKSIAPERIQSSAVAAGRREIQFDAKSHALVDPSRIEELKQLNADKFDFSKLIRMCEELNVSFATECHFAVAMLTRAILDHVPPIFGARTFSDVSNHYGGSKSFKASMQTLENSSRNIADHHLHCQIRSSEILPNAKQVDFGNDLDVLLSEIVRFEKATSDEPS